MNYMQLAHKACDLSRESILKYFRGNIGVEWKEDNTPVTIADQEAEARIREYLKKEMPHSGFIGEEYGNADMSDDWNWIIDPIDGTKSFIKGVPLFGTLLALYKGNKPVLGIIDLPALNSRVYAEVGQGAWVDGKKAKVSSVASLNKATVLSGTINTIEELGHAESFAKLRQDSQLYRGWGDCYGYYMVATGQAEVMFDPVVSIWDVAPMLPILTEAGGAFSDMQGATSLIDGLLSGEKLEADTCTGVASNGLLHELTLKHFR